MFRFYREHVGKADIMELWRPVYLSNSNRSFFLSQAQLEHPDMCVDMYICETIPVNALRVSYDIPIRLF